MRANSWWHVFADMRPLQAGCGDAIEDMGACGVYKQLSRLKRSTPTVAPQSHDAIKVPASRLAGKQFFAKDLRRMYQGIIRFRKRPL